MNAEGVRRVVCAMQQLVVDFNRFSLWQMMALIFDQKLDVRMGLDRNMDFVRYVGRRSVIDVHFAAGLWQEPGQHDAAGAAVVVAVGTGGVRNNGC